MIHVVDTHALTRYIEDFRKLGAVGRRIFDDPDSTLMVPTIALAEARFMIFRNKVQLIWEQVLKTVTEDHRILTAPLTVDVLDRIPDSLEMHDGIIVAATLLTSEAMDDDVRLITRDKDIRESGLVQTVW
jgi:PIN domain nuclease of toxin-antitoxin system